MLLNQPIIYFSYFIIQYFIFTAFFVLLSKFPVKINKCIIFSFVLAIISTVFTSLLPDSSTEILSIFNILLIYVTSILIFKINNFLALIFTTICAVILYITNIFCLSFNILIYLNHYIFSRSLVLVIVATIFYKFFQKLIKLNISSLLENIPEYYVLPLILILSYNFTTCQNLNTAYILFFTQSLLSILIIKLIKNKYVTNKLKLSNSALTYEYCKLKAIIDDIRMFKHDYNNTLCSIGGYISLNDMNGLKGFYNKLTSDLNKTNTTQLINPKNINEPSIYNILMAKYNSIIQKGLTFEFYSAIDYKNLEISPYDLSKILGIFLDNAIDASKESCDKYIYFCCEMLKNNLYRITIKNSYTNKDIDIEKIFLKGYSSKKVKSGIGLWEVSKIIKNMPNVSLQTKKDEKYFVQELTIASK